MNYSKIKKLDISNGLGVRVSFFCCGCTHHCNGCFNSEIWNFKSGKIFDEKAKNELFTALSNTHVKGISILGGEPLQQGEDMLNLIKEIKNNFKDKDIWLWTGYYLNELNDLQKEIVSLCDYVVDGRFDSDLADCRLKFRGSSNQTIYKNENGTFIKSEMNDER